MIKYTVIGTTILAAFEYNQLAWAQTTGRHMMSDGWWSGWFFGPIAMIFCLAIFIAIVALIVRAIMGSKQVNSDLSADQLQHSAIEILKKRFARGEIEKEEFEAAKKILEE